MNKALDIIKSSIILLLITSVSAAMLAYVNGKTAPLIEKNAQEKQSQALMAVADDAVEMREAEITDEMLEIAGKYEAELECIYKSVNDIGELTGYCAVVTVNGYDSGLQVAVGTDFDSKVCGVEIIASNETPGLGLNASKPEYIDQYKSKSLEIEVVKGGADGNKINALSGATITSRAITRAVNAVLEISEMLLGENEAAKEAPLGEALSEEVAGEETPVKEAPAEETPEDGDSVKEISAQEAAAEVNAEESEVKE